MVRQAVIDVGDTDLLDIDRWDTDRFGVAFSLNGRFAVCVRAQGPQRVLESWAYTGEHAVVRTLPEVAGDRETVALPLDDGRLVLAQRDPHGSDRYELTLRRPGQERPVDLGSLDAPLGVTLLPDPERGAGGATGLGVIVARDGPEHSTIWRATPAGPVRVAIVPGLLAGGAWAGPSVLALNQHTERAATSGIVVDLADGTWRRVWWVTDTSVDRIVLADPRSGLFVVTTDAAGAQRVGWGRFGEPTVRFPDALQSAGGPRGVLTLDERGERILGHHQVGAVSRLFVHTPATGHTEPVAAGAATISGPARWTGPFLRCVRSTPDQPRTLATARLDTEDAPRWSHVEEPGRWVGAELVELPGPTGPVEAVVYGGAGWRQSPHLVVALHGGPLSAWRFEYQPLLQRLAAAGVAVLAPNQRGSTGYGEESLRSVLGDWGGPDLDDVLHLVAGLDRDPALPRPVVLGASYGGFLALLAACRTPAAWSGCVALAPFLSLPRLAAAGNAAVHHRVARLGGTTGAHREPPDVLRVCAALSAPLLLVHGTRDHTIPVEQSRTLHRRLLELGRTDGVDLEYREVDGDHEDVVMARGGRLPDRVARFCLSPSATTARQEGGAATGGRWR